MYNNNNNNFKNQKKQAKTKLFYKSFLTKIQILLSIVNSIKIIQII
jgi:hypothetical protein